MKTTMKNTKMKMALAAVAVVIGAGGLASGANAADWMGPRGDQYHRGSLFDRLDINNNGKVSRREFQARYGHTRRVNNIFSRIDTNHSNALGQREVANARGLLYQMRMRG